MRPVSVIWFERLFLLSVALALVSSLLQYDLLLAQVQGDPALAELGWGGGILVAALAISVMVPLLLWYLIARRASNPAKWVLAVLVAIGLYFAILDLTTAWTPGSLVNMLVFLMEVVAVALLFRPDARAWLGSRGDRHVAP